jgi:para-aminobenzoate synthetase component I
VITESAIPHRLKAAPACPDDLAQAWAKRRGFVFLDTDAKRGTGLSIIAAEPTQILQGNLFRDAAQLREVLLEHQQVHVPDLGAPTGGLFGWVGYEGDYVFGLYPTCQVYQHGTKSWLQTPEPFAHTVTLKAAESVSLHFEPQMSREVFCRLVSEAQRRIAAGDIYQVNLSYPWLAERPAALSPWNYYQRLRATSPAPYGAYLDLEGTQVMSASPECFLKMSGNHVLTRPIKGTRPRGDDQQGDQDLATELLRSAKERAELVMITDLERNDLGQVCDYGSVHVSELLKLERYAQVHHLVSTVEGSLRADVDHVEALSACFPGGSITGAPKKMAREIIAELEPSPRGLYTGAIGYLGFNGESQFSIAIRTAVNGGNQIRFHAGAGIVADSVPGKEWEETQHKAAGLLQAAKGSMK